jgi:hypothetical protein
VVTATTPSPPKRITWAPSVTGGIAPIATYQTATINPASVAAAPQRLRKHPLTEPRFYLPASPSILASKATPGASAALYRADHTDAESSNLYQQRTSTTYSIVFPMSPSHPTSPALPHKLLRSPMPYNQHTLSLTPSPANHTNMPN